MRRPRARRCPRRAPCVLCPSAKPSPGLGCVHLCSQYLLALQERSPKSFTKFLATHRPKHRMPDGTDFEDHARQPIWRCVEHVIKLLVRTVEVTEPVPALPLRRYRGAAAAAAATASRQPQPERPGSRIRTTRW
jgi:hypothetical protein